jgi:chromosome segregation ATPase
MTKLARLTVTCLVAALPLTWIRAADTTPPVVIESAPEADVSKLQQEIAALRAENQRLTGELRDAQWALAEAKTRIDELNAPKPAPEPNAADAAAEKARADEANARLATLVAGVEKLNQEKTALENRLTTASKTEAELRQQLAAAQQAAHPPPPAVPPETVARLSETENKLSEANRQIALLKAENQLLNQTSADHARLNGEVQSLRQDKAALEAKIASAAAATPVKPENDAAELASKLAQSEAKLATVLRSYSQLQAETDRLKSAASTQNDQSSELAKLRQEKAALEAKIASAEATTSAKAENDTAELAGKLAQSEARLATVLHSYSQLQAETDRLKSAASTQNDQSSELATLRQEKAALEARIAAIPPDQSHVLASKLADVEDRLSTTLHSYTLLQRENDRLKADADKSVEAAQASAAKSSSEAATQASTLFDELRQTQAQATALAAENAQLKTRLALVGAPPGSTMSSPTRPGTAQASSLAAPAPVTEPAAPAVAAAPQARTHVVVLGDTLGRISRQSYGTPSRWDEILRANRDVIKNENVLTVGMTLRIP